MGGILCFVYDLFRVDRVLFKRSSIFVFLQDVLFWVISAFVFFSFSVVFSNGQIRGYLLFGTALGFLIFRLTISRLIWFLVRPLKKFIKILKKKYNQLLEKLLFCIVKVVKRAKILLKKIFFNQKIKNNKIIEKNS